MAESFTHRRRKVDEKSCVTPAGTSNELDVQNDWEENNKCGTRLPLVLFFLYTYMTIKVTIYKYILLAQCHEEKFCNCSLWSHLNVFCMPRSRSTPVAQSAPRNLLTRWDVSSIPANGIFLTKN